MKHLLNSGIVAGVLFVAISAAAGAPQGKKNTTKGIVVATPAKKTTKTAVHPMATHTTRRALAKRKSVYRARQKAMAKEVAKTKG